MLLVIQILHKSANHVQVIISDREKTIKQPVSLTLNIQNKVRNAIIVSHGLLRKWCTQLLLFCTLCIFQLVLVLNHCSPVRQALHTWSEVIKLQLNQLQHNMRDIPGSYLVFILSVIGYDSCQGCLTIDKDPNIPCAFPFTYQVTSFPKSMLN